MGAQVRADAETDSPVPDVDRMAALVSLLLNGRPKGYTVSSLPVLWEEFGHLPPFDKVTASQARNARDLKRELGRRLERWLPANPVDLRAAGLPDDAGGRRLVTDTLTRSSSSKLPTSWDSDHDSDGRAWSTREKSDYLGRLAVPIAQHIVTANTMSPEPRPDPPEGAWSQTRPRPTWQHADFDDLHDRPDTLAKLFDAIAGQAPLIVLTGPPGTGKSNLLVALLRRLDSPGSPAEIVHATLREPSHTDPYDVMALLGDVVRSGVVSGADSALADLATLRDGATSTSTSHERFLALAERTIVRRDPDRRAVVVVDAVDQLEDADRDDVIDVLSSFAKVAAGTGFRIIVTSRRALPRGLPAHRAIPLSLDDTSDPESLEATVAALLHPLPDPDAERVLRQIMRESKGSWLWASLTARNLVERYRDEPVPATLQLSGGLSGLWHDGMSDVIRRTGRAEFERTHLPMLACLAVASDGRLREDELRWVAGLASTRIRAVAGNLDPFVRVDDDGVFRLCHPDFGRWVLGTHELGHNESDAHVLLASALATMGTASGWGASTAWYGAANILDHFTAGFCLTPFRPDRDLLVAAIEQLVADPAYVATRRTDGLAFCAQLTSLSVVVPSLGALGMPLSSVMRLFATDVYLIEWSGTILVTNLSALELAPLDDVAGLPLYEAAALVTSTMASVNTIFPMVWSALLDGLLIPGSDEYGRLCIRLDLEQMWRYARGAPEPDPWIRQVVGPSFVFLASREPELALSAIETLWDHPGAAGLTLVGLCTLAQAVSSYVSSPVQAPRVAAVVEQMLGIPGLDGEDRADALAAADSAYWSHNPVSADIVERHLEVAEELAAASRLLQSTSDVPTGGTYAERNVLRVRIRAQRLIRRTSRVAAPCLELIDDSVSLLDAAVGGAPRLYALGIAADAFTLFDVGVVDPSRLDQMIAVFEELLTVSEPDDDLAWRENQLANAILDRWRHGVLDGVDPPGLQSAHSHVKSAMQRFDGDPPVEMLHTECELLAESVSAPTLRVDLDFVSSKFDDLSRSLDSTTELDDEDRGQLTADLSRWRLELEEARAAAKPVPESSASSTPGLGDLRSQLEGLEPGPGRVKVLIEIVNLIRAADDDLRSERIGYLDEISTTPNMAASTLTVVLKERAWALLAAGDETGVPHLLGMVTDPAGPFGGRVAGLSTLVDRLREDTAARDRWTPRLLVAARALEPQAGDDTAAAGLLDDVLRRLYVDFDPSPTTGSEVDRTGFMGDALSHLRRLDDAADRLSPGTLGEDRAKILGDLATVVVKVLSLVDLVQVAEDPDSLVRDLVDRASRVKPPTVRTWYGSRFYWNAADAVLLRLSTPAGQTDHGGRRAVDLARTALRLAPAWATRAPLISLYNALGRILRSPSELDEAISVSTALVEVLNEDEPGWWLAANAAIAQRHTRHKARSLGMPWNPDDRAWCLTTCRTLLERCAPESAEETTLLQYLYLTLDDREAAPNELDEEIELRLRVLPRLDPERTCLGCAQANLAVCFVTRATQSASPARRVDDMLRARGALVAALASESDRGRRADMATQLAGVLMRLTADGTLDSREAFDASMAVLRETLPGVTMDGSMQFYLQRLPPTIARALKNEGLWPGQAPT